jgi:ubiquitin C-terminal hydrolase
MTKLKKSIDFDHDLKILPFLSGSNRRTSNQYRLYAFIVHSGRTCQNGHYYSYVRGSNDKWIIYDDDKVSEVDNIDTFQSNLDQAYIMFYERADLRSTDKNILKTISNLNKTLDC